jgi:hypothetical protein
MKMLGAVIIATTMSMSTGASAHGSSHPSQNVDAQSSIITADVATDGYRTTRVSRTTAGDMVVCPHFGAKPAVEYSENNGVCKDAYGQNAWQYPKNAIPAGKTYVGFRITSGYAGSVVYEFYWK